MKIVADINIPFVDECFSSIGDVFIFNGREITSEVIADANALIVRSITKVNRELLEGSNVRFVGTSTIGFDHIDIDYLNENKIGFASAPGSNANSAAEYIIGALLEVGQSYEIELSGKSIGVIGVGNVGSKVASKCEALGMQVLRNDPPLQRATGDPVYVGIEQLYDCDFITFHTPLTFEGIDKTFHLADEKFFQSLKKDCIFLNASRGAVVDSDALKKSITAGRIKATVLDVWENEPQIDADLLELVDLGTPHIAGYSFDGKVAGMIMIYEALCKYFGKNAVCKAADFLPEPAVDVIEIDYKNNQAEEQLINSTVKKVYDIIRDDENLRKILTMPINEAGLFFDSLRKEYPVRREFYNTKILLKGGTDMLAKKLKGLGFGEVICAA